jgi:hypothetical protein
MRWWRGWWCEAGGELRIVSCELRVGVRSGGGVLSCSPFAIRADEWQLTEKGRCNMSRYTWEELVSGWQRETLTPEQMIGQLLLWGQEMATQLEQLTMTAARLQRHLEITESRLERLERRPPQ